MKHALDRLVSHEARHGTDHEVRVLHRLRNGFGLGQVCDDPVRAELGHALDTYRVQVHHEYVEVVFGGEVTHDRASNSPTTQHYDLQGPFSHRSGQSGQKISPESQSCARGSAPTVI